MKNKRAISLCMLLFSLFNFTACEKTENAEVKVDLFDNEKALNISKDYLFNIKNGNIDGANKLCTDELLKGNVNIDEGISKISSFDKEKSIEGHNFAYYIYNIIFEKKLYKDCYKYIIVHFSTLTLFNYNEFDIPNFTKLNFFIMIISFFIV